MDYVVEEAGQEPLRNVWPIWSIKWSNYVWMNNNIEGIWSSTSSNGTCFRETLTIKQKIGRKNQHQIRISSNINFQQPFPQKQKKILYLFSLMSDRLSGLANPKEEPWIEVKDLTIPIRL